MTLNCVKKLTQNAAALPAYRVMNNLNNLFLLSVGGLVLLERSLIANVHRKINLSHPHPPPDKISCFLGKS